MNAVSDALVSSVLDVSITKLHPRNSKQVWFSRCSNCG